MDFSMPRPRTQTPEASNTSGTNKKKGSKLSLPGTTFMALTISLVVLVVAMMLFLVTGNSGRSEKDVIKSDRYQAVFLDDQNGQVYFGHLSLYNSRYYQLTDIYYVKVDQVQPEGANTSTSNQNVSLAKLGKELHGPEDSMFIPRDKVLFWENLTTDGQVAKAIEQYKATGGADSSASPTPQASSSPTPTPKP